MLQSFQYLHLLVEALTLGLVQTVSLLRHEHMNISNHSLIREFRDQIGNEAALTQLRCEGR